MSNALAHKRDRLAAIPSGIAVRGSSLERRATPETDGARWTRAELAQGRQVLDQLCRLLQRGCFPCSDDPDDLSFSPYRRCVGDGEAAAAATLAKLSNPDNNRADGALAPFAELRGLGPDGHGSDAE